MRARLLKPGFFDDADLARLPMGARLLFAGLWCMADREGLLIDSTKKIAGDIFPHDANIGADEVDAWLDELSPRQIVRYSVDGGNYIQIKNFSKHQTVNVKERASGIPKPSRSALKKTMPSTEKDNAEHVLFTLPPEAEAEAVVLAHAARSAHEPSPWSSSVDLEDIARRMHKRHPNRERAGALKLVMDAIVELLVDAVHPDTLAQKLDRCHEAACKSKGWTKDGGEFVPGLAKWIRSRDWDTDDEPVEEKSQYRPVSEVLAQIRGDL